MSNLHLGPIGRWSSPALRRYMRRTVSLFTLAPWAGVWCVLCCGVVCVACKFGQETGPRFSLTVKASFFGQGIGPHLPLGGNMDDGSLIMMSPILQRGFRFGSGPIFGQGIGPQFPFGDCSADVFWHMFVFCLVARTHLCSSLEPHCWGFTYGLSDLVMVCSWLMFGWYVRCYLHDGFASSFTI